MRIHINLFIVNFVLAIYLRKGLKMSFYKIAYLFLMDTAAKNRESSCNNKDCSNNKEHHPDNCRNTVTSSSPVYELSSLYNELNCYDYYL